jgi:hypothetical protein
MVMRLAHLLIVTASLALVGCATPIPLDGIQYPGTVATSSDLAAKVNVVTGAVHGSSSSTLVPIGSIFVPISSGPVPELQFHAEDQRAFGQSLRAELSRLRLFKTATTASDSPADVTINVLFAQTFHNINMQIYTLDVAMEILGGPKPFLKQYRVISSEKDSTWEKWNTNAYEGKAKAVKLLLEKLIPDIESYVPAVAKKKPDVSARAL